MKKKMKKKMVKMVLRMTRKKKAQGKNKSEVITHSGMHLRKK
jgi:hypothetical protein